MFEALSLSSQGQLLKYTLLSHTVYLNNDILKFRVLLFELNISFNIWFILKIYTQLNLILTQICIKFEQIKFLLLTVTPSMISLMKFLQYIHILCFGCHQELEAVLSIYLGYLLQ